MKLTESDEIVEIKFRNKMYQCTIAKIFFLILTGFFVITTTLIFDSLFATAKYTIYELILSIFAMFLSLTFAIKLR